MTLTDRDTSALCLPPELEDWTQQNHQVMDHIYRALDEAEAPLTDIQLWNLIARTYSRDWTEARAKLQAAEQKITIHKSHENRPLGSIGMALESDTVNDETNNHSLALALFTIIDEELREHPDLKKLHGALLRNQLMLESARISQSVTHITAEFGSIAAPDNMRVEYASPLKRAFHRAKKLITGASKPKNDVLHGKGA